MSDPTWDQAARRAAEMVTQWGVPRSVQDAYGVKGHLEVFDRNIKTLQRIFALGPSTSGKGAYGPTAAIARRAWCALFASSPNTTVPAIATLVISKHRDYGQGNITAFGVNGLIVRLSDKVERFKNLASLPTDPANESVVDTLIDMIGYAILIAMVERGWYSLPLQADIKHVVIPTSDEVPDVRTIVREELKRYHFRDPWPSNVLLQKQSWDRYAKAAFGGEG